MEKEDMSTGGSSIFQVFQWVLDTFASYWLKLNWLDGYQPSWAVVLLLVAVAVYSAWYYLLVVNKPRVVGGGTSLKEHVLTQCPILSRYYYPTFWACGCHFTTIGRAKLQKCPGVTYSRYIHVNTHPCIYLRIGWKRERDPAEFLSQY